LPPIEPHLFSFNSPQGACFECKGLGSKYQIDRSKFPEWKAKMLEARYFNSPSETIREELEQYMIKEKCPLCLGSRLNQDALSVTILGQNIYQIVSYRLLIYLSGLKIWPINWTVLRKKKF